MPDDDNFNKLMAQAKRREPAAIGGCFSRFRQEVRMMVRASLPKKSRTQFDSLELIQAVWQSFFVDGPLDSTHFEKIQHVRCCLAGVARNKVFQRRPGVDQDG